MSWVALLDAVVEVAVGVVLVTWSVSVVAVAAVHRCRRPVSGVSARERARRARVMREQIARFDRQLGFDQEEAS